MYKDFITYIGMYFTAHFTPYLLVLTAMPSGGGGGVGSVPKIT